MATRLGLVAFSVLLAGFLIAAGCAPDSDSEVGTLPPPSYNAPTVARPYTSAPRPQVAVAPAPRAWIPTPPPTRTPARGTWTGVPADWVPHVPARPWKWIVIHHTATAFGNAAIVTQWHLARGFDEMGYHFLIGNGTNSGDGQVEVGTRWPKQKWGAHTKTPDNRFNDFGIGICLVGNFDVTRPTPNQMRSLDHLVAYLMQTYHIPPENVLGHGDCKSTDCPGRNMSVALVRHAALQILVDGGDNEFANRTPLAFGDELMHDVTQK